MWFDSWSTIGRTVLVGAAAYVSLVVILRLAGKRTLSKLNAFDLVVTVAFGSTLASILLSTEIALAEGVTALALLALLQVVVAWSSRLLPKGRWVVTASPTLLVDDGEVLEDALREQRVTRQDVLQAARSSGVGGLDEVAAVVLESDGSMSVVTHQQKGDGSALAGLRHAGTSGGRSGR
ncbi:DUF421 domain-containing protein [Aquipuribacter nitratireducens]|uniref:DUF421 domain-containing protein n=1 Tax=Aquipuribacter nitratireducens TaxID=650104 RepID=A0ABW0GQ34_9MICO